MNDRSIDPPEDPGIPVHAREREILVTRVPELPETLAEQAARLVRSVRALPLRKPPSVSESIDWARTLLALGVADVDPAIATDTLHVLLKHQTDIEKVTADLEKTGES